MSRREPVLLLSIPYQQLSFIASWWFQLRMEA
jgi:hypothetical protein